MGVEIRLCRFGDHLAVSHHQLVVLEVTHLSSVCHGDGSFGLHSLVDFCCDCTELGTGNSES